MTRERNAKVTITRRRGDREYENVSSIFVSYHAIGLFSCLLTLHSQGHDRTRRFPTVVAGQTGVIARVVTTYTLQHQTLGTHDDAGRVVLREHRALSLVNH